MNKSNVHNSFRKRIPLFREIPNNIYYTLDMSGFYLPTGAIANLREELELTLQSYVVSYKANECNLDVPVYAHLCAIFKGADLNKNQQEILRKYETRAKKYAVTFVVYVKPIAYLIPEKSAIYQLYRQRGLLTETLPLSVLSANIA